MRFDSLQASTYRPRAMMGRRLVGEMVGYRNIGRADREGLHAGIRPVGAGVFAGALRTLGLVLFVAVAISMPAAAQVAEEVEGGGAAPDSSEENEAETSVSAVPAGEETPIYGNVDPTKIPIDEKKSRTEAMLVDQRQALARASEILAEARSSKDIVQLNCVNEKLTQIKGLLKISEQASLEMYEAIANNASDLINHEYTKIVVAHQKSQILKAEAEQCVGESSVYAGDTSVEVLLEGDGGGFAGDPTTASAPPPGPAVPPVASTF